MTDLGTYAGTPVPKVPTIPVKEPWGKSWDNESTVDPMSRSKEPLYLGKQYPICDCPSCVRVRAERDLDQGKPAGWSDYVPSGPAKESFDEVLKRLYPDMELLDSSPAGMPVWKVDASVLTVIEVIERLTALVLALDNAGAPGTSKVRLDLLGVLDEAAAALVDLMVEDSE